MIRNSKILLWIISLLFVITAIGCSSNEQKKHNNIDKIVKTELLMGTAITVTIYNNNEEIIDKVFNRVREIESKVSLNEAGTEIDKINNNAGIRAVKVSDDSFNIINRALEYSIKSDGNYDLTIGPLVKLWSIGLPEAKVPTKDEITETLTKIDYKKVNIDKFKKEIYLEEKGMKLDLGSIAKGYAADEITNLLKNEGINKAIIDLGGNIYVLGEKSENMPWVIGIQNPFNSRGEIIGTIGVKNKSIVTSGIYERYIEENGKKYHHILNPETGYPYESEITGVTLITDKSIDGDALSTLIFTKGIKEGMNLVDELKDVEAIFISNNKEVYLTNGVKDIFNITDGEFRAIN